eukprot:3081459-Rhodomonas_salina.2
MRWLGIDLAASEGVRWSNDAWEMSTSRHQIQDNAFLAQSVLSLSFLVIDLAVDCRVERNTMRTLDEHVPGIRGRGMDPEEVRGRGGEDEKRGRWTELGLLMRQRTSGGNEAVREGRRRDRDSVE